MLGYRFSGSRDRDNGLQLTKHILQDMADVNYETETVEWGSEAECDSDC
jgi:hypothetical protein